MTRVYVVQSEEGHYFSKQNEWLSGKEAGLIYFGKFRDEALNQLIDITIKDVSVRAKVVETNLNHRKHPELEIHIEHDLIDPNETLDMPQDSSQQAEHQTESNVVTLKTA